MRSFKEVDMDEILEILAKDARITVEEISRMTGKSVAEVKKKIKSYEKKGIILKYKTIINKELLKEESLLVQAIIEVQVTPQKNLGFDYIAERIYRFPEVVSCYLVSGTYDLLVIVEGKDIHTVSNFVAEKLAPLDGVRGTVTHFMLKRYKENGDILKSATKNTRVTISY
jgi:DNA-binding Lrp family transcriptional regulator